MKKCVIKIIIIFGFLSMSAMGQIQSQNNKPIYQQNPNYESFMNLFKTYKTQQADIVLLGNSITQGGNWNELLGRSNIANRGIPGDVLEGFLARIDGVLKLRPKICIIMGGINDIYAWIPVEDTYKNYLKVIRKLKTKSIKPIIVSTLYAAKSYHSSEERNKEVTKLNEKLEKYAEKYNYEYIDLNKYLSKDDYLREDVTFDGIHLNWLGYKTWADQLDKVLKKLGY